MPAGDIAMFEQLRELAAQRKAYEVGDNSFTRNASSALLSAAADEIERLRKALLEITRVGAWVGTDDRSYTSQECRIANAALAYQQKAGEKP